MIKEKTLKKVDILNLLQEVRLLRSAFIGQVGKDVDGQYNPEFVKQVLKDSKEEAIHTFKDKKTFLQSLKK